MIIKLSIWIIIVYVFYCNIVIVNHFLYCFIILLHLISSFLCIISLFVAYAYVFIKSFDCILLSSLALNVILLTSLVNTPCFSVLNICCEFSINLLFFYDLLWFSRRLSTLRLFCSKWFVLFLSWVASKQFL